MAKSKIPPKSWLTKMREDQERRRAEIRSFPLLAERWWVAEIWPDRKVYNEYDYGADIIKGDVRNVSGMLKSKEEAEQFIEDHVPDDPKGRFEIKHQYLRRHTKVWNEWGWI